MSPKITPTAPVDESPDSDTQAEEHDPDPVDVGEPLLDTEVPQPLTPSPQSEAPSADPSIAEELDEPACPTGAVTVSRPTSAEIVVEPTWAEVMQNLGMGDLTVPGAETNNLLAYSGGMVKNGTTSTITLSNLPNVSPTGVDFVTAFGGYVYFPPLAPGESVPWEAAGSSVFVRADVTGFELDATPVGANWVEAEDAGCAPPPVLEQ